MKEKTTNQEMEIKDVELKEIQETVEKALEPVEKPGLLKTVGNGFKKAGKATGKFIQDHPVLASAVVFTLGAVAGDQVCKRRAANADLDDFDGTEGWDDEELADDDTFDVEFTEMDTQEEVEEVVES